MSIQHTKARLAWLTLAGLLPLAGMGCSGNASDLGLSAPSTTTPSSTDDAGASTTTDLAAQHAANSTSTTGAMASATITASTTTSTSCALPTGTTRTTSSGTICGPHPTATALTSDCCNWTTANCYPPNSADLACGTSTSGTLTTTTSTGTKVTTLQATISPTTGVVNQVSTIQATSTGSTNPRYHYWVVTPAGTWTQPCGGYISATSCAFTPTTTGTWQVAVSARDVNSTASYDITTNESPYTVAATAPAARVTSVSATATPNPTTVNTAVTVTATSVGSTSPRYVFNVTDPSGAHTTPCGAYAAAATCSFTPTTAGAWSVTVLARDSSSTAAYDATTAAIPVTVNTVTTTTTGTRVTSVSYTASPSTGVINQPTTIRATSTGSANPQYHYWVVTPAGAWTQPCGGYTAATSCAFTPTVTGTWMIAVSARDITSTATYDATSNETNYTVGTATTSGTTTGTTSGTTGGTCGVAGTFADTAQYTRERYVSTSGSDSADGSQGSPWRTISHAASAAVPGDRVHVLAGTYGCGVSMSQQGTSSAPIAIISENGAGAAIMDCGGSGEGFTMHGVSYVTVDGLEIRNTGDNGLHMDGSSAYVEIRNCHIHNTGPGGDCIKINQSNHIYIDNNDVHDPGSSSGSAQGIDMVAVHVGRFSHNHVHNCSNTDGMFAKGGSQDVVFDGNLVEDITNGEGILLGGATDPQYYDPIGATYEGLRLVARNNVIRNVSGSALSFRGCQNCEIVNNTIFESGTAGQSVRVLAGGNNADQWSSGGTIANNIFAYPNRDMRIPFQLTSGNSLTKLANNYWFNGGTAIPGADISGSVSFTVPEATAVVNVDPQFTNGTGGDYHIGLSSRAAASGMITDTMAAVTGDRDAVCRPTSTAPSAGAYQAH